MLDKYDEELDGEKKKSFKLGSGGVYDSSMDKFIEKQNEEFKSKAIKLDMNDFKLAKDYLTLEEQQQESFKKPKKMRKKLRKVVKADDLVPLAADEAVEKHFGSRKTLVKQEKEEGEINEDEIIKHRKKQLAEVDATSKKLKLKDLGLNFDKKRSKHSSSDSEQDQNIDQKEYSNIKFDDDDAAFSELHNVLDKVRRRVVTKKIDEIAKRIHEENDKIDEAVEMKTEPVTNFDELETEDARNLTLDSMSEFCRNLGDLPAASGVKKFEKQETVKKSMDVDEDEDEEMNEDSNSDDEGDERKKKSVYTDEDHAQPILDDEPVIDRGLASALALAVNKGYLEEEKMTQNARLRAGNAVKDEISALNYTIEEKSFYDIDDKYSRNRDRYSGPISDFREKESYKPDVKLEYVDEKGHRMNEKEAFRYLSHRFHGKGPGKKKTEKRMNKIKELESVHRMSSVDTPLNTVALLVEKQKKMQQPYVVLSAPKAEKADQ